MGVVKRPTTAKGVAVVQAVWLGRVYSLVGVIWQWGYGRVYSRRVVRHGSGVGVRCGRCVTVGIRGSRRVARGSSGVAEKKVGRYGCGGGGAWCCGVDAARPPRAGWREGRAAHQQERAPTIRRVGEYGTAGTVVASVSQRVQPNGAACAASQRLLASGSEYRRRRLFSVGSMVRQRR